MLKNPRFLITFTALALLVAGCSPAPSGESVDSSAKKVATFDGGDVTLGELQTQVEAFAQQSGQGLEGVEPGSDQFKQLAGIVLPQVVQVEVAQAYADEHNLTVSEQDMQQELDQIKEQVATQARSQGQSGSPDELFQQALAQVGLTEDDLRAQIHDQVLLQKVQQRVAGDASVSEEEARDYYEQNKDQFTEPEQREIRHILFPPDQKQKAEEVKQQIEDGEISFAEAAKKYSEDPQSAQNGGDLGFAPQGQFVEAFDKAAFNAEEGEIVGPVETEFGYHLIEVTGIKKENTASYEEVSAQINNQLTQEAQSEEFQRWLQKQTDQRNVEYLEGYQPQEQQGQ